MSVLCVTIVLFLLAGGNLGAPTTEKTRYYYPYDKNYVIPEPSIYEGVKRICRDISISDWFWLPTNILWDAMVCTWIPYEEGETYWEDLKRKQQGWF